MNKAKLLDRIHVELGADIAAEVSVILIDHAVVPNEISADDTSSADRLRADYKAMLKALEEKG